MEVAHVHGVLLESLAPELLTLPLVTEVDADGRCVAKVGRQHQSSWFQSVVPDPASLNSISRTAFELVWDASGVEATARVLGSGMVLVNSRVVPRGEARPVEQGSRIALASGDAAGQMWVIVEITVLAATCGPMPRVGSVEVLVEEVSARPPPCADPELVAAIAPEEERPPVERPPVERPPFAKSAVPTGVVARDVPAIGEATADVARASPPAWPQVPAALEGLLQPAAAQPTALATPAASFPAEIEPPCVAVAVAAAVPRPGGAQPVVSLDEPWHGGDFATNAAIPEMRVDVPIPEVEVPARGAEAAATGTDVLDRGVEVLAREVRGRGVAVPVEILSQGGADVHPPASDAAVTPARAAQPAPSAQASTLAPHPRPPAVVLLAELYEPFPLDGAECVGAPSECLACPVGPRRLRSPLAGTRLSPIRAPEELGEADDNWHSAGSRSGAFVEDFDLVALEEGRHGSLLVEPVDAALDPREGAPVAGDDPALQKQRRRRPCNCALQ